MSLVQGLNNLDTATARDALRQCCAAEGWVTAMLAARPFQHEAALMQAAADIWWSLGEADWSEAFASHPRIGDLDSLRAKFAGTRGWAEREQAAVEVASEATLRQLAQRNREYEDKFGYIFILCASGKTADQMLAILNDRLRNSPATEVRIAAQEQLSITQLRLSKLGSD